MSVDEDRRIALNDFAGGGIPALESSDGPCGIRGEDGATALPSALTLAASFDVALAQEYGDLLGSELRASGHNVLLGPVLCIARDPRSGRLGEGLGEDPLLTGELGGHIVRGVQAHRAIAVAKHYVAYNLELLRTGEGPPGRRTDARDVNVSPRALREIYLWPFRRAVQRHGVVALLAAYVRVNGTYVAQSPELLALPRREWGFDGFTVPDMVFAVRDADAALAAGLDLPAIPVPEALEPLSARTPEMVAAAADDIIARIGAHVRSAVVSVNLEPPTRTADRSALATPAALRLAERVAVDGAVLLRNDGVLPLGAGARIALIGGEATAHRLVTGGSAGVPIPDERLPDLDHALGDAGISVVAHAGGLPDIPLPPLRAGDGVTLSAVVEDADGRRAVDLDVAELPPGEVETLEDWSAELTCRLPAELGAVVVSVEFAGAAELVLDGEVIASGFREASPLIAGPHYVLSALVPDSPDERVIVVRYRTGPAFVFPALGLAPRLSLGVEPIAPAIAAAVDTASGVDAVVVLAGRATGAGMDADSLGLPAGQAALIEAVAATGTPVVAVLHGSGPIDMPWRARVSAILHLGHPGERFAPALAAILSGAAEPGGRLPVTWPNGATPVPPAEIDASGRLPYVEGVDVGYRGYERSAVAPAFSFGHGLGYARIELIDATAHTGAVRARLRCGPARGGKAVVQLYARAAATETLRMVGFAIARLDAAEERDVQVTVDTDALAMWSGTGWVHPDGAVDVHIGFSRGDLRRVVQVALD